MDYYSIETITIKILIMLIALPVHELAHGYVAWRLGDPTARDAGRITLNPFKHLDLLGSIMMLSPAGVGWAKPVPVNSGYFKNRKSGMILVSLAGPLSNLLLALFIMLIWGFMVKLIHLGVIVGNSEAMETILVYLMKFFSIFTTINIYLAVFNLLPIPPLDGSRLISAFVPEESYYRFARYEQYIGLAFIALVILLPGNLFGSIIGFFADPIYNSMQTLVTFVFGL